MSLGEMCPKFRECVVVASVTIRQHSTHPPSDIKLVNHLCVLTVSSFYRIMFVTGRSDHTHTHTHTHTHMVLDTYFEHNVECS